MSDTPRTDRAVAFDDDGEMVSASFARSLERELAEMKDFLDSETCWAAQYKKERDQAEESVRRLSKLLSDALQERDDAKEYLGICMQKLEFGSTEDKQ